MFGGTTSEMVTALHRVTGAPAWMCRLVLDACDGNRRESLRLVKELRAELPEGIGEKEGRGPALGWLGRADTPKHDAIRRARADARAAIARGELVHLGSGLLRKRLRACVPCRVLYSIRAFDRELVPERCPRCDDALVRFASRGCSVDEAGDVYIRTYNALMDTQVRAKYGTKIVWHELRDEEIRIED